MAMTMNNSRDARASEMNVTPLIDVLLVLLIIFMVITPLKNAGFDTLVPQAQNEPSQPSAPPHEVVLQVIADPAGGRPALKINQEAVAWSDLHARVRQIFAPAPDKLIFVKGDADVEFNVIAEAIDIARSAGVERVALVTANLAPAR